MGDFLRGMMGARPFQDPHADLMRQIAAREHERDLRERRAMKALPGMMQGDPDSQMRLAAMGIGPGPETPQQAARRAEEQKRYEAGIERQREKFAWEKGFAEEGRKVAMTRAEQAEAAREKRFKTEMDYKKEQTEKADLRARARAESEEFEKLETERRYKEEKAYRKTEAAKREQRSADAAKRAAESHQIMMRRASREEEARKDQEAITANVGVQLKQRMVEKIDKYLGPMPEGNTPEAAIAAAQRIGMQGKLHEAYLAFGGSSNKISDRRAAYEMALDEVFPEERRKEAIVEQMENMYEMELAKAAIPEKIEAELERRRQAAKAEKKGKAKTAAAPGSRLESLLKRRQVQQQAMDKIRDVLKASGKAGLTGISEILSSANVLPGAEFIPLLME
jgi:hypothetical protein